MSEQKQQEKDPAFLLYSADFMVGTFSMTDEQVGRYVRLMCLQHAKACSECNEGYVTEQDMAAVAKNDPAIVAKFKKNENGTYYNERLAKEMVKRKKLAELNRKRIQDWWDRNKGKKDSVKEDAGVSEQTQVQTEVHSSGTTGAIQYENENRNVNGDVNENEVEDVGDKGLEKGGKKTKRKPFVKPTLQQWTDYFLENGFSKELAERSHKGYDVADWHDTEGKPILNWKQKAVNVWFKPENKNQPHGTGTKKPTYTQDRYGNLRKVIQQVGDKKS